MRIKVMGREVEVSPARRDPDELQEIADSLATVDGTLTDAGFVLIRPVKFPSLSELSVYEALLVAGARIGAVKRTLRQFMPAGSLTVFIEDVGDKAEKPVILDYLMQEVAVVRDAAYRICNECALEAARREHLEAVLATLGEKDEAIKVDCLTYVSAIEGSL